MLKNKIKQKMVVREELKQKIRIWFFSCCLPKISLP
jgi:hypothetical protein